MTRQLTLHGLSNIPLIQAGDDLGTIISDALDHNGLNLEDGDILVLAQKIVSKSENRQIDLNTITPSQQAIRVAEQSDKNPRLVEVILSESRSIIRLKQGVIITEHNRGWIMANAGIDASNVECVEGQENILLLPLDPDASAAQLKLTLDTKYQTDVGVIINDSFGRPWRLGTTSVALGAAGLPSLWDRRGDEDLFGRELKVSQQALADELATAASLLQGQAAEGQPVILLRGFDFGSDRPSANPASTLIRDPAEDMFR